MGYEMNRNSSIPKRLSSTVPFTDNLKCIRSGTLMIYSEELNHFEECQLKLYQDYLTYMKNKVKCIFFILYIIFYRKKSIIYSIRKFYCINNQLK